VIVFPNNDIYVNKDCHIFGTLLLYDNGEVRGKKYIVIWKI